MFPRCHQRTVSEIELPLRVDILRPFLRGQVYVASQNFLRSHLTFFSRESQERAPREGRPEVQRRLLDGSNETTIYRLAQRRGYVYYEDETKPSGEGSWNPAIVMVNAASPLSPVEKERDSLDRSRLEQRGESHFRRRDPTAWCRTTPHPRGDRHQIRLRSR